MYILLRLYLSNFVEFVNVNNDSRGKYNGLYLHYDNEDKVLPLLNVSQVVGRNQVTFQLHFIAFCNKGGN